MEIAGNWIDFKKGFMAFLMKLNAACFSKDTRIQTIPCSDLEVEVREVIEMMHG